MSFLDEMKKNTTIGQTENGAKTFTSTLNHNLDLYSQAGAMRSRIGDAQSMFVRAFCEDEELALRNIMYLRDVRGGLGEREAFRQMFKSLIDVNPELASKLLIYIPFVGRWDDLAVVYYYAKQNKARNKVVIDEGIKIIREQLAKDVENANQSKEISLMAKWIPSTSVKNKERKAQANAIAHDLGYDVGQYRKLWSSLRRYIGIIETKLSEKDYDSINFETLPSRALYKYRQAFERHLEGEYEEFISKAEAGEVKMNTSNVLPYEIVRDYQESNWMNFYGNNRSLYEVGELNGSLEATWKHLDNHIGEAEESVIVVADTSASMMGDPWFVAQSLALYSAERLNGPFANHFITFSTEPQLVELPKYGTLKSKLEEYNKKSIVSDTDIEAVFKLILDTAVESNAKQEDVPSKIIIVSDMEFNQQTQNSDLTAFENAKEMFEKAGYKLPNVVFWNVDSRNNNTPVRHNEQGVALVSGLTPQIFKQILLKEFTTPEGMMVETLMDERYDFVKEVLESN